MIRIDDILEAIRSYHADADLDAVRKAYVYSAKVHQGQTRLSGDSYMTHLMEVASILTRLHMDVPALKVCFGGIRNACCILHMAF